LWSISRGGVLGLEQAPGTVVAKETETKWPASHKVREGAGTLAVYKVKRYILQRQIKAQSCSPRQLTHVTKGGSHVTRLIVMGGP
jgi:hypothetical protein